MPHQRDRTETFQRVRGLQRQNSSGEETSKYHDRQRSYTDGIRLLHHIDQVQRFAEDVCHRLQAKQNIILNCLDFFFREIAGRDQFHAFGRRSEWKPRFFEL